MLLVPLAKTASYPPVSIFSLIIWSKIPLLPFFSKAHHWLGRDYISQTLLHADVTIWLSSGQRYLRGSHVCNFWILSFKKKAICLYNVFLTFCGLGKGNHGIVNLNPEVVTKLIWVPWWPYAESPAWNGLVSYPWTIRWERIELLLYLSYCVWVFFITKA